MTGPASNKIITLVIGLIVFFMVSFFFIGGKIYKEHKVQAGFRELYKNDWKTVYEQRYGPGSLSRTNAQTVVGFASMPVIGALLWLIYWQITRDKSGGTSLQHRKSHKQKKEW